MTTITHSMLFDLDIICYSISCIEPGQIVQTCADKCERMKGCEYFSLRDNGWCIGCTTVPSAKYSNTDTFKMGTYIFPIPVCVCACVC